METKELSLSEGRKGVQLTLPSPSLSQSGHYACVAENRFERVEEKVLLTVYPPGMCTLPLYSTVCILRPTWPHPSPPHIHTRPNQECTATCLTLMALGYREGAVLMPSTPVSGEEREEGLPQRRQWRGSLAFSW